MANTKMLKERIEESGITITALSRKLNMSRENFYNRLEKGEFKVSEMIIICNVLQINDKDRELIFFANDSEYNSHNNK